MGTADLNRETVTRYEAILSRISKAAFAAGRAADAVKLVAVTKTFEEAEILPVLEAGHRIFGENRVQEAMRKWPPLKERYPDIELHLVGPLQSNKARDAVALFDVIHTLDRPSLAAELQKAIGRLENRPAPRILVQVNTGYEPQKAGVEPEEAARLVEECRTRFGITVQGLMCIPPVDDDPETHFEMLARLGSELALPELSMGMSGDFETAISCGATMVRVGSAIFGERPAR